MALQEAMVSSKSAEHATPQWLYDLLDEEFHFTLDPCANAENAKCKKYYTIKENGLLQDWSKDVVFVNPPYCGNTPAWVKKACEESEKGSTVVMLLSAATGRKWFHEYVFKNAVQIRWIKGFIKFVNSEYTAPFASVIVVFSKQYHASNQYIYNYLDKEIKTWQKSLPKKQ
jgi:site-specific DNA-methyltransferase (adenine-specific)